MKPQISPWSIYDNFGSHQPQPLNHNPIDKQKQPQNPPSKMNTKPIMDQQQINTEIQRERNEVYNKLNKLQLLRIIKHHIQHQQQKKFSFLKEYKKQEQLYKSEKIILDRTQEANIKIHSNPQNMRKHSKKYQILSSKGKLEKLVHSNLQIGSMAIDQTKQKKNDINFHDYRDQRIEQHRPFFPVLPKIRRNNSILVPDIDPFINNDNAIYNIVISKKKGSNTQSKSSIISRQMHKKHIQQPQQLQNEPIFIQKGLIFPHNFKNLGSRNQ